MEEKEFLEDLIRKASQLGIHLSEEKAHLYYQYMELLLEWNEKINLTAITDPHEIILKHFIDSLTALPYIPEKSNVLDIGTGAGFPGIPLKIVNNNSYTLMDSLNKRITFLQEVIKELRLENIEVVHARAEDYARNNEKREKYQVVIARAVASLNILVEYMLPMLQIGGVAICMKGSQIEQEIVDAKKAVEILGGKIEAVEQFELPESNISRTIIVIKKIKNTPNIYPRKAGIPTKKPL